MRNVGRNTCFHPAKSHRVFPVRNAKPPFHRKNNEEHQRGAVVKRIFFVRIDADNCGNHVSAEQAGRSDELSSFSLEAAACLRRNSAFMKAVLQTHRRMK